MGLRWLVETFSSSMLHYSSPRVFAHSTAEMSLLLGH